MRAILLLIMFAVLAVVEGGEAHAASATNVFITTAASVVVIEAEERGGTVAQGSGVVFGREMLVDAWVATNCHVVSRAVRLRVNFASKAYPAELLGMDTELDLCVLLVDGLPAPAAKIRSVPALTIGEPVYAIGAPRGLELSLSDGIISQFREHPSTYRLIQTTVAISPGSSGGGLFDSEGRLIGITTFSLRDSQNLNFAVPANAIEDVRHASIVVSLLTELVADASNKFASSLDQALPEWRRDLQSNGFERWLGLARDAKGQRRTGGISGFSILALPPESWQPAVELFRDYRSSPFFQITQQRQEQPRPSLGAPEWRVVARTQGFTLHGDRSRIRRQGNRLIAWSLADYPEQQALGGKPYRSTVRAHEIECDTSRIVTRQATFFSSQMGAGEAVYFNSQDREQLEFANPGSLLEQFIAWACSS